MTALHDLSAVELLARYRDRSLSPVEVTRAVLERIAAWEPHLHATYALDGEAALAAARASEARWSRRAGAGEEVGALEGVPTMIKENIATAGTPVPLGTAATELVPAPRDAPPAARLREAGAVILGKTTMPDYGMLSSGLSSFHGLTRNPWDLRTNPGGSSAGAGAGVAAGYGPLHLGTDIGGSVRLPASWCGIFTLKPSLGRIPIDPPYAGRVAGPMTRTVADAALMMGVLAQPDDRDATSLPAQEIEWQRLERDVAGLRIGLLMDAGVGLPVDPEVAAAVEAAARRFEAAGARIVRMAPFMTRTMFDGMDDFWRMRAWLDISALREERRARILPFIVAWAKRGATLSGERVFRGYSQMAAMRDAAVAACRPYDVVLSPTSPIPTYDAELAMPTDDPERPFEHIGFTLAFNMSEQPAASIDCGRTRSGLPIGLQIVGHRHDDLGVLQVARAWEAMRPTPPAWPEPPLSRPPLSS
jgi:Asp-tRNA(Asn)/Glu-tRNA(Gln) amidotransferase A subunit family amidase